MPAEMQNLYAQLGVCETVAQCELHPAFVQRAFAAHSDQGGSEQSFKQTLRALEVLAEPEARRQYDQCLRSIGHHMLKMPIVTSTHSLGQAESLAFFRRLHSLLRRLPKETRRQAIMHRLNGTQRRDLECWIRCHRKDLRAAGSNASNRDGIKHLLSERSLCRHRVRGRSSGYRPTVHLVGGLYAHAAYTQDLKTALGTLGYLVVLRSFCRAAFPKLWSNCQSFEARLRAAFADAFRSFANPQLPRLYFRVKLTALGAKFSTPVRQDLTLAIADWHRMQKMRSDLPARRKICEQHNYAPHSSLSNGLRWHGAQKSDTGEDRLLHLMDRLLQRTTSASRRLAKNRTRKGSISVYNQHCQMKRAKF